ncbi:MAG: amidophosphoribosyltransferase [Clostridia bacterium]|nr:amidophosphoribosyltransferase [Clostridia bacterium]
MKDTIHDECGVFGIFDHEEINVAAMTYSALYALQHRGQESCGIAINDDGVISGYKNVGLVNEVFDARTLGHLTAGQMAVGHVRYSTAENGGRVNAQPLIVNHCKGCMAIANNGSLTNAAALRREMELTGSIFQTTTDVEVIANAIVKERLTARSIEQAIEQAMYKMEGCYTLCVMSPKKLIAVRDPHGFRPLCIGQTESGGYVFASESCALDAVGAKMIRDVRPGEIVIADEDGLRSIETHCGKTDGALCVFEYVYIARPDSVIDGTSVHAARKRAGVLLARESQVEADVIVGVPDSGLDAALGYAQESGIPYGIGFLKNKYIGRTFIQPTQKQRENLVRIKLNPIAETVKGKRVVLIDDSIVRGTTSARIVKLLREAGATEVHMRIASPPVVCPCYYGVDISKKEDMLACRHTIDEIRDIIGVDTLAYLSVDGVRDLAENTKMGFCSACFTGNYPVEVNEGDMNINKYQRKFSEKQS